MALATLSPGFQLQGGKYTIVKFIAAGGFGCTYEGLHVMLNRRVAIKEFYIRDYCNRDEQTSQVSVGAQSQGELISKLEGKFLNEARALCRLNHAGIVHVYDVFEENGTAYYVMDFVDGHSLKEVVDDEGALPESRAVKYISQVADALGYVHGMNMLHLDVKPNNIIIDKNDDAILIDFGAAKQYDTTTNENNSTLLGQTMGYAPLEQISNEVKVFSPSTDIYALGATLYKIVTGNTPPDISVIANGNFPALPASLSVGVRNAIIHSMSLKKTDRPQSTDEFLKILKSNQEISPVQPKATEVKQSDDEATVLLSPNPVAKTQATAPQVVDEKKEPKLNKISSQSIKAPDQRQEREAWVKNFIATHNNFFPEELTDDVRISLSGVSDQKIKDVEENCVLFDPEVVFDKSKKLGMFGVDRFYIHKTPSAVLKLLFFVAGFFPWPGDSQPLISPVGDFIVSLLIAFIWYFIDLLRIKKVTRNLNYVTIKTILLS
jgi:serine/threonine protein kinase